MIPGLGATRAPESGKRAPVKKKKPIPPKPNVPLNSSIARFMSGATETPAPLPMRQKVAKADVVRKILGPLFNTSGLVTVAQANRQGQTVKKGDPELLGHKVYLAGIGAMPYRLKAFWAPEHEFLWNPTGRGTSSRYNNGATLSPEMLHVLVREGFDPDITTDSNDGFRYALFEMQTERYILPTQEMLECLVDRPVLGRLDRFPDFWKLLETNRVTLTDCRDSVTRSVPLLSARAWSAACASKMSKTNDAAAVALSPDNALPLPIPTHLSEPAPSEPTPSTMSIRAKKSAPPRKRNPYVDDEASESDASDSDSIVSDEYDDDDDFSSDESGSFVTTSDESEEEASPRAGSARRHAALKSPKSAVAPAHPGAAESKRRAAEPEPMSMGSYGKPAADALGEPTKLVDPFPATKEKPAPAATAAPTPRARAAQTPSLFNEPVELPSTPLPGGVCASIQPPSRRLVASANLADPDAPAATETPKAAASRKRKVQVIETPDSQPSGEPVTAAPPPKRQRAPAKPKAPKAAATTPVVETSNEPASVEPVAAAEAKPKKPRAPRKSRSKAALALEAAAAAVIPDPKPVAAGEPPVETKPEPEAAMDVVPAPVSNGEVAPAPKSRKPRAPKSKAHAEAPSSVSTSLGSNNPRLAFAEHLCPSDPTALLDCADKVVDYLQTLTSKVDLDELDEAHQTSLMCAKVALLCALSGKGSAVFEKTDICMFATPKQFLIRPFLQHAAMSGFVQSFLKPPS